MAFVKTNSESVRLEKGTQLFQQTYEKAVLPSGVVILKLVVFPDDFGGWFKEMLRIDNDGCVLALKEQGVNFSIKQTNMSFIAPSAKRFWHIHPKRAKIEGQNEIWITNSTLLVGLVDLRSDSPTYGVKSKIILSPDKGVYIPSGVAHGLLNPNLTPVTLTYFTDKYFLATDETQELRIDPKDLPFDFVEPELM